MENVGMKHIYTPLAALMLGSTMVSSQAIAASWADRISLGGFTSINYSRTNESTPFNGGENVGHDDQGSWSSSRIGLNLNAQINKRVRFATQMFASKDDSFGLNINWGFIDINLNDELNLRTGKIKFPAGLVNEYVDVGYTLPWITAPAVIYSELGAPNGPQMTRESYTGASLLGSSSVDDWTLGADLFTGEVELEGAKVRELAGLSLTADWDDTVLLKASAYEGTMRGTTNLSMEGAKHKGTMLGLKADWNDVIVYAEHAMITMGNLDMMKATSWYTTVGYQMGKFLPHLTYQSYEQGKGSMQEDAQNIVTAGLRWDWMPSVALKVELSQIKTDKGFGLFPQGSAPNDSVNMIGLAIDTVF
jgi:Gram-negative porin